MNLLKRVIRNLLKNSWLWIAGLFGLAKTASGQLAIAPPPMPREEVLSKIQDFLLIFVAIFVTIIGIVWYQKNKATKKWFQFFTSKTFFISLAILAAISIFIYWWFSNNLDLSIY